MKKSVPILEVQDNCFLKFYSILLKDGSFSRTRPNATQLFSCCQCHTSKMNLGIFWDDPLFGAIDLSPMEIFTEKNQFHRGQKENTTSSHSCFFGVSGLPSKIDKICYDLFSRGVATHHIVNKKEAFKWTVMGSIYGICLHHTHQPSMQVNGEMIQ